VTWRWICRWSGSARPSRRQCWQSGWIDRPDDAPAAPAPDFSQSGDLARSNGTSQSGNPLYSLKYQATAVPHVSPYAYQPDLSARWCRDLTAAKSGQLRHSSGSLADFRGRPLMGSLHESALSLRPLGRSMNGLRAGMSAVPLIAAARVAAGVTSLTCHQPTCAGD
jgi:hypothetical protein